MVWDGNIDYCSDNVNLNSDLEAAKVVAAAANLQVRYERLIGKRDSEHTLDCIRLYEIYNSEFKRGLQLSDLTLARVIDAFFNENPPNQLKL